MGTFFTSADINELRNNPSDYVKLDLISKISNGFAGKILSDAEKSVANDILHLLAQDISTRIRMNISEKFCRSAEISYKTIKRLAQDFEDLVAIPVVQFSDQLSETDLINIITSDKGARQRAVARRENLNSNLVNELVVHGGEHTIEALIDSNGKKISKENSSRILEKHKRSEAIIYGLFAIDKVAPENIESLLGYVSDTLRAQIVSRYNIPSSIVDSIVSSSKATISHNMVMAQIAQTNSAQGMKALAGRLHQQNQLSLNLIIKILGHGDKSFFLAALSLLAEVPEVNIAKLLNEDGHAGVVKLFEKAKLPSQLAEATKTTYNLVEKLSIKSKDISKLLIENLEELVHKNDDSQLRYVLNVIKMP
jgi:uncharacterized protein (DUF2336 family)